jgi:hypothetical protein
MYLNADLKNQVKKLLNRLTPGTARAALGDKLFAVMDAHEAEAQSGDLPTDPTFDSVETGALVATDSLTLGKDTPIYFGAANAGWKDLTGDIILRGKVTDPEWAQVGASPFWAYKAAIGDIVWLFFHINHDYKPGGDIYLHVHWMSGGTGTEPVAWQFNYGIAKGHNQANGGDFPIAAPNSATVNQAPGGQYRHMVTETALPIDNTNAEVDALLWVAVERVTNGATNNTDDIFLLTVDCHYQAERIATPNRAPDFYA